MGKPGSPRWLVGPTPVPALAVVARRWPPVDFRALQTIMAITRANPRWILMQAAQAGVGLPGCSRSPPWSWCRGLMQRVAPHISAIPCGADRIHAGWQCHRRHSGSAAQDSGGDVTRLACASRGGGFV